MYTNENLCLPPTSTLAKQANDAVQAVREASAKGDLKAYCAAVDERKRVGDLIDIAREQWTRAGYPQ